MKNAMIAVLALFILLPACLFAQKGYAIDKGVMIVDGSAGFVSAGGDMWGDDRSTRLFLNPSLGFFVVPHLAIGATFDYMNWSDGDDSNSYFGFGPKVSYYFGDSDSKVYPFVAGSFFYFSWSDLYTQNDLKFEGGAAFMIAKNVAITGNAFYRIESQKWETADESESGNTFGVEFGVGIFIF
jgi:hypothetical protein